MVRTLATMLLAGMLAGCDGAARPPLALAGRVDLPRFMGDWYVIAAIPTLVERNAYAAVESYRLAPDGRIETTFTFRAGAFDGTPKRYTASAKVLDPATNAVWGMQVLWPFEADFRVLHLSADYRQTVIGREKRDHAWIMARSPELPESDYQALVELLRARGYHTRDLRRIPQRPS